MYKLLIPLAAIGLGACGGGSTTDPNNFIINTPPGTTLSTSTAKSFSQATASSPYVVASGNSTFSLQRTNSAPIHQATFDLVINGTTYKMTPASNNSATSQTNSYVGTSGGTTASVFLNENTTNASIANIQLDTGPQSNQFFGIVGTATPAANLPTTASYSGGGEISVDKAGPNPIFDDAPNSTVSFTADFTGGTIIGQFNVQDGSGENSGSFDIAGSATLPLSGTITGNTFTANVDYTNLIAITNGLNSVNAQAVEGGFYGANAENAVGVGLSVGTSSAANDVVVYTRIQANKQ